MLKSLVSGEMQIRTTVRHHFTPTEMTKLKKKKTIASADKAVIKLLEYKMVQLLWNTVWQFLKISNIHLPHNSTMPGLGIYPRELETHVHMQITHECS